MGIDQAATAATVASQPPWLMWLSLLLSPVVGAISGTVAAYIQIAPVKRQAKERSEGYGRRAISELSELRDRLDDYYAVTKNEVEDGGGQFSYVFYWDLTDPSILSSQQEWSTVLSSEEEEEIISLRSALRSLRDYLRPIQKVEKVTSSQAKELTGYLEEASRACGSVVTALERLHNDNH